MAGAHRTLGEIARRAVSATPFEVAVASVPAPVSAATEPVRVEGVAFSRGLKSGDRCALTYVPGKGTTLSWNGTPLGTAAGEEFAVGFLGIWTGANPLDRDLKRLLLED
jgi:hypothetical protein